MTKGDLERFRPFNRPFKPVGLGMSVLMATLVIYNVLNEGALGTLVLGDAIAVLAAISCVLLILGWIRRSQTMAEYGLLCAAVVYITRSAFLLLVSPLDQGVPLSLGAAIIAGGAYLLEIWDGSEPYSARGNGV